MFVILVFPRRAEIFISLPKSRYDITPRLLQNLQFTQLITLLYLHKVAF